MAKTSNYSQNNPIPESEVGPFKKGLKNRVLDCEKKKSQKGFPMLHVTLEVTEADPILQKVDGVDEPVSVDINGLQFQTWIMLGGDTEKKTKGMIERYNDIAYTYDLPEITDESQANAQLFIGKILMCVNEIKDAPMLDDSGKPILNPFDGTPETTKQRSINLIQVKKRAK